MEQTQNCKSRPGPKPDPHRAMVREMFKDWSDRTFSTYWSGHQMLCDLERSGYVDRDGRLAIAQSINDKIVRPNGTFSVSRYERECAAAVMAVVRAYDAEHDEAPAAGSEGSVCGPEVQSTHETNGASS